MSLTLSNNLAEIISNVHVKGTYEGKYRKTKRHLEIDDAVVKNDFHKSMNICPKCNKSFCNKTTLKSHIEKCKHVGE